MLRKLCFLFSAIDRWYKYVEGSTAKQPVKLDERVKQVSGTLIIKEAKVDDSGKYLCNVNNSVGGESVETVLTVTGTLFHIQNHFLVMKS